MTENSTASKITSVTNLEIVIPWWKNLTHEQRQATESEYSSLCVRELELYGVVTTSVERFVEEFGQDEPMLALNVACDGAFIGDEYYDVEQMSEVIAAVELAVAKKKETPDAVVTIVVGRVQP